jgi:hypothetical protein
MVERCGSCDIDIIKGRAKLTHRRLDWKTTNDLLRSPGINSSKEKHRNQGVVVEK